MSFSEQIIKWYQIHKRDLPWRNTKNPYIIWLSEIILQQTRVEQGKPYFFKFLEAFPTIQDFASAHEDEILKLWQGLGYYSRGRNMHVTAKTVVEQHLGNFPTSYAELIKLKGIGEYTAAAIASFAVDEVKAVVDGNVFRVLARYFGIDEPINSAKGKKLFMALADELIEPEQPGLYNQAVMEFGSLQCKPKNPNCESCPLQLSCIAYQNNKIQDLPVKLKLGKIRNRYFNYVIVIKDNKVLMNKRGSRDIWENLHEFPLFETEEAVSASVIMNNNDFQKAFGNNVQVKSVYTQKKHVLSHQYIFPQFIVIENFTDSFLFNKSWTYFSVVDARRLARPKLIFEYFNKFI